MGWAVDERGEHGLAEEALGPGDQRTPRPELAVERLLHEHHHAHADPAAADALRREHPVVAGLSGLHPDVSPRFQHLGPGPARLVVELPLVGEDGAQLPLHRHDLRLHELDHAGRRALYDVADVLRYTYIVGHAGHSLQARAGRKQYIAAAGLALAKLQPPRSRPASRYRPCTARDPR